MAPRRILYLHSSAGRYGADRQLALLATGVDRERFEPLVVLAEDGPLSDELRTVGIETLVRPLAVLRRALLRPAGLARVGVAWARDARELGRLIRERDVALVHSNTSVTLGGAPASKRAGIPHIWHVRELYAGFERQWPVYRRRLLAGASALACVSEAVREQFGGDPRARVIHDGLPALPPLPDAGAARAELGLPASAFVVAVPGRISTWKGQDVAIRALAEEPLAAHGRAFLLIAGDAWPGEEGRVRDLRRLVHDLGLDERVRFAGFRDDVETVYAAADVVAVPSTQPDPLPNSALEAGAAGCCVVAAAHGGLREILRDGETGVLVEPRDSDALSRALADLDDDPLLRAQLGAAAAADIGERFSASALLERISALYEEVLSR